MRGNDLKKSLLPVFFVLVSGCIVAQDAELLRELFPQSGYVENWLVKDSIQEYDADKLFEHTKGSTDLFVEFGTRQSARATYTNPKAVSIELELFRMDHPDAAWGIFSMLSSGKGSPLEIGDAGILYDYYLHLVKGDIYLKCTTTRNDPEYIETIRKFARAVSDSIPAHAKEPALLKVFQFDDLQVDEKKYFEGQLGLQQIINFGHGMFAGFGKGSSCRSEEKRFIVLMYETERKRREWFASAKGKMDMNQRFTDFRIEDTGFSAIDRNGFPFSFQPYREFILILKGYTWSEAQPQFEAIKKSLDTYLP